MATDDSISLGSVVWSFPGFVDSETRAWEGQRLATGDGRRPWRTSLCGPAGAGQPAGWTRRLA